MFEIKRKRTKTARFAFIEDFEVIALNRGADYKCGEVRCKVVWKQAGFNDRKHYIREIEHNH